MMFRENEIVNLNGKDYKISRIEWSKGHKACMLCASTNGRPPCIDLFDYPESKDTFGLRQCMDNIPEFHIPKLVRI